MKLLLAASAAALAMAAQHSGHEHAPQLGKLKFETSCNAAANAHVQRGLGWLHSFEYQRAERSFAEAAAADSKCPIASWGRAMSYYHPLWAAPTPDELAKATAAMADAKRTTAGTPREAAYIAALDTFYRDSAKVDHKARALAYSAAMGQLHESYPDDHEAAVLYALSLVAAGTMDSDPNFSKEKTAGAILNQVLALEPDHPGVAHYLIHSFDYPALAELALPAARRYAGIAPASAHAQHMPSHIFTRLGLWDEAIKSNQAAEEAARAWGEQTGMSGAWDQRLHAMDYLAYAYLQTGRDADAARVLENLKAIKAVEPPSPTAAYAVTSIPARMALERRQWAEAAALELPGSLAALPAVVKFKWAGANIWFARAVGAARSGKLATARQEVAALSAIEKAMVAAPGEYDWGKQVSIQRQVAQAWLAQAEGRKDEAIAMMRAAADLDDATEKHPVTPGAITPAREQLGELLTELGQPADALQAYEASLKRAPRRLVSLHGAAKAARLAGDAAAARRYDAELIDLTKQGDASRAEIREVKARAAELAAR